MTIEQTVEIPADHRLTIDVPREIPAGKTILTFTPASDRRSDIIPLPGGSSSIIEEARQIATGKAADPNRKPISRFFGILSPETYGDGVTYQRQLRDEWDA